MASKVTQNKKNKSEDSQQLNLAQMEKDVDAAPQRNLEGSLEQCKEELRDAYINFKEHADRCIIDLSTVNKVDKPVYYFKPDTFLTDNPEKQQVFREALIKKISAVPKPEPITYLGDEMHKIFLATVADQSRPTICKKNLAMFFKRRQYSQQHLKYKVLQRWAHHAMNSSALDTAGKDAVFLFAKIEHNIEHTINRADRLEQEDFFDQAIPKNRPNTKADLGEGSLYVENCELDPQSLIREDDIEVYMRSVSYRNKVSKVVNKFMARLKWLPMLHRFDIFEKALESKHAQKNQNIKKQMDFIDTIEQRAYKHHIKSPEMVEELNDILNTHYTRQHAKMFTSQSEKVANSWRCDHDNVPDLINNQHQLKLKIIADAKRYGIEADIELDHGYSYSYRVTVRFPGHFQKQCIKSQFSLYDVFARESDQNEVQKHTLSNMTKVDTSIFRDISTTPNMVPDDESFAYEMRNEDIKVIRMKSCAYWIDYVCLSPNEPDWYKKQQALLNNGNPTDTLSRAAMDFLDASDLASVNRTNEDNALLHQQNIKKLQAHNPHDMVLQRTHNSNEGEKKFAVNMQNYMNSMNEATNINKHLLNAVQGGGVASQSGNGLRKRSNCFTQAGRTNSIEIGKSNQQPILQNVQDQNLRPEDKSAQPGSRTGLRNTPHHLLVSFYTLRYMKSRDNKIRILYAMNFNRAIQKRICLDLREFGTRERVDSHLTQPYVHSTDADKKIVTNVNLSKNPYEGMSDEQKNKSRAAKLKEVEEEKYEKMMVFDADAIANMKNMASVRMYKQNGTFNNKIFSTCPSVPKFHSTFGEPTMRQTEDIEMDLKKNQGGISKQSLKLMGRTDHIQLDEELEEVYVKDDFGVYILYDCVLQDMKGMEEELIKICSYFINKAEVLQDVHTEKPQPVKDRLQTLSDLLECEAKFQFKKVKLCMTYLECYEHIVDPLEQQRLMQVITDLMARRPRLNLQANYFEDAYEAELLCLDKQLELLKVIIKNQIGLERTCNRMLQDQLSLSYTLCNQYEQNKFQYQDAEELLQAVISRSKNDKAAKQYRRAMTQQKKRRTEGSTVRRRQEIDDVVAEANHTAEASSSQDDASVTDSAGGQTSNAEKKTNEDDIEELSEEASINSDMSVMDILHREDNVFQSLLGLPEISIETLYLAFKEKDKTILNIMRDHVNFINIHEGYPEFLDIKQGGSNGEAMRTFQVAPWSEKIAYMDFYDSLTFVNKFASIMSQISQELYDALKPYDPTMMTYIDAHIADFALKEFQQVLLIQEGAEVEYEGRQYVEDESVVGNSDKLIFYAKEMISQLTMSPKNVINPYLIAKLNLNSINFFDFPRLEKSKNMYKMQYQDGVRPADWVINNYKQHIVDAAKLKSDQLRSNVPLAQVFASAERIGKTNSRNIDVPTQLKTYCNAVELMRLRHEIILAATECSVLEKIYMNQVQHCGIMGQTPKISESISFDHIDIHDDQSGIVNWIDDGPSHNIKIALAVREFDSNLLSNFNFRNPDSFKLNITDAGIEEVRAILAYQIMHKHLLIVATRLNQLLIDSSVKAVTELDVLKRLEIVCPNSTFDVNTIFSRNADNISSILIKEQRDKFRTNLTSSVGAIFYDVAQVKRQMRTDIQKEYSNYMSKVVRHHPNNNQCVQRVMRSFKVKQLIRYCETIMIHAHLDAQKVQAVQVCQRLRTFSQYFTFDPAVFGMAIIQRGKKDEPRKEDYQVFKYETAKLIENFTYPYMPPEEVTDGLEQANDRNDIEVINPEKMKILDLQGIPSSANLIRCESSSIEEIKAFKQRLAKVHLAYNENWQEDLKFLDVTIDDPEKQTKAMLPTLTLKDSTAGADGRESSTTGNGGGSKGAKAEDAEIDKQGYPILDYEEALHFGRSNFAVMFRYYQYLERILSLEWFICKLQFNHDVVVHVDDAFNLGLPFWVDTDYEKRMAGENVNLPIRKGINIISQNFLHSQIVSRQSKKFIAEEISNVSLTMQNLIRRYRSTKDEQKYEYLNSYSEFRYMQILGSFHKIIQQFYVQRRSSDNSGIRSLRDAISQLAKIDHVRISFTKGNSYHVNTSLVHPQMQLLENTNLIFGAYSEFENQNFMRCVQPVINEKALEPPQLTLFQSLFQTDSFRKRMPTQFAGQLISTHNAQSFRSLDTALLDMSQENRQYSQSFIKQAKDQAHDFMEMVYDPNLATMNSDEVYTLLDLVEAKKYLADGTQSLLLKNALICWNENQVLPDSPEIYAKFDEHFKNSFFWKIIQHKENMIAVLQNRPGDQSNMPTKGELKKLKMQIEELQANYSLATMVEEDHRAEMVAKLNEEFRMQKKKVTLDQYYTTKAEIQVLSNEIEKHITRASVQTLDAEHAALSRCFNLSQPKIQMRIHPFQQFAATLYDDCDPNKHLDMVEKLNFVQEFITKLRNRGTKVETLTSGPGVVFTCKDFNEAIQSFCRKIMVYGEQELKSRSDLFCQKEEQYLHLIYVKDQKVNEYDRRIKNQAKNIDNIISARLFEKGNNLIYQLDSTSRLLTLFKQSMYGLENEIKSKILGEQSQKFKLQKDTLDTQVEKLGDYKKHVSQIVGEKFSQDYEGILISLKKKVEQVWNIDPELSNYIPPTLYPATGDYKHRNPIQQIIIRNENSVAAASANAAVNGKQAKIPGIGHGQNAKVTATLNCSSDLAVTDLALEAVGTMPGSVVPDGFIHYSHCTCFKPNKKYPNYTIEHAELEMYTEQEARFELARTCEVMRKQRLFWRTKEMLMKQKFQTKINLMKKQLSNNAYLWDQMAEGEKRESILKQELLFTQQSLSASEKVIEKLQEEMKKVEADRQRLVKYKHSKAERLKELEDKIKKFEVYENIDTDKLISVLGKKDQECRTLTSIAENFTNQLGLVEHQKQREVGVFKHKLVKEQVKTQQIVEKMEQMKLELKMLESNDTSVAAIWKKKCLDLFDVCQTLKTENEELRDRCKELIVQGMQLADAVTQEHEQQNQFMMRGQQPASHFSANPPQPSQSQNNTHISLPRLETNKSVQRINMAKKQQVPGTAPVEPISAGRAGTSTANTYEIGSNMGGYPITGNSRMQQQYGIVSQQSATGNPAGYEDMVNPLDSPGRNHIQSPYASVQGEQAVGQSLDSRFASTMQQQKALGQKGGGIFGPASPSGLNSPQLGQLNQRSSMRGPQQRVGNFPMTQHAAQRGKTVGIGNGGIIAGPAGPTYHMPRQQERQSATKRGLVSTPKKDTLLESSFNQSFQASGNSDKFGSARMNYLLKTPKNKPALASIRHQQNNSLGGSAAHHNDSLFECSKASTRRNFGRNVAGGLLQTTQPASIHLTGGLAAAMGHGRQMIVPYNQRQNEMMNAAVLGSKMLTSKQQQMTNPSSVVRGSSTKPGSLATEEHTQQSLSATVNQLTSKEEHRRQQQQNSRSIRDSQVTIGGKVAASEDEQETVQGEAE